MKEEVAKDRRGKGWKERKGEEGEERSGRRGKEWKEREGVEGEERRGKERKNLPAHFPDHKTRMRLCTSQLITLQKIIRSLNSKFLKPRVFSN
jgi:hypothetical protein